MKKFLFTLAALMMAGSLSAAEYMYIDDFEVSQDLLAQTSARQRRMNLPVKAHFDYYVNGWQVDMTFGEGMTYKSCAKGSGMDVTYMTNNFDDAGQPVYAVSSPDLGASTPTENSARFVSAISAQGYWFAPGLDPDEDDPVAYGAVKWIGDYDQMFTITVEFAQTFTGGDITIVTAPASGNDARGQVTDGTVQTKVCHVTVESTTPEPEAFVGTADVTFNGNVATISYTSNDPNATVEVTLNGQPLNVTFENGVATWEAPQNTAVGEYSYTVAIKVTPDGVNYVGEPVQDSDTYSYTIEPEPTAFVGTASVTFDQNVATLTYTSNDPNATVVVTVNNEPVEVTWENGTATWTAPVYTEPGNYRYEVTLTVTPDGVNYVGTPATATDVFAYDVLETTETPEITIVEQNAHHCYFTVEGDGVVTVLVDGEPAETVVVEGVTYYVVYAVEGQPVDYVITATAWEQGKYESLPATENVHFDSWDAVSELVNGKTVAGVRYYNMAGQEMQQANGMTIVVTTYTDGTTSAVKVMK